MITDQCNYIMIVIRQIKIFILLTDVAENQQCHIIFQVPIKVGNLQEKEVECLNNSFIKSIKEPVMLLEGWQRDNTALTDTILPKQFC